jgi:hypothetical protein
MPWIVGDSNVLRDDPWTEDDGWELGMCLRGINLDHFLPSQLPETILIGTFGLAQESRKLS